MASRRNAVRRQKALDDEQTKEAMKILEKYCRKKYRHSIFAGDEGTHTTSEPFTPFSTRQMTFDRASTAHSTPFFESRPPLSPSYTFDFTEHHSVKEEIKFDKTKETWSEYLWRLFQFFYNNFVPAIVVRNARSGVKHILLIVLLIWYALLGGYVFFSLEAPAQKQMWTRQEHTAIRRHYSHAVQLVSLLRLKNCTDEILDPSEYPTDYDVLNKTYTFCQFSMRNVLKSYDAEMRKDLNIEPGWTWDFWNAVFYSGTIFTTIGYGNLSCKTKLGRLATIVYALFGVPLMLVVLNSLGKGFFSTFHIIYEKSRKKMRRKVRTFSKSVLKRSSTIESVDSEDVEDKQVDVTEDSDLFETFPLYLALIIVFAYIFLCAVIFCHWEEWDYFTSFYFFFISLSTVGLGDVLPLHPKYACSFFLAFIIGLALVSMCISILQLKVENKYMAALQLIDQEHQEILENIEQDENENENENSSDAKTPISLNPRTLKLPKKQRTWTASNDDYDVILHAFKRNSVQLSLKRESIQSEYGMYDNQACYVSTPGSVRWRSRDSDAGSDRNGSIRMSSNIGDGPPPVLGVFMARSLSAKHNNPRRSIVQSENLNSRARLQPYTFSSEMDLTPSTPTRSPWPQTNEVQTSDMSTSPMPGGSRATGSVPNLAVTRQVATPLSVITEGDEEAQVSRNSSKKRPPSLSLNQAPVDMTPDRHIPDGIRKSESMSYKRSISPPRSLNLRNVSTPELHPNTEISKM